MIKQLDHSNFEETINSNKVVLVDFYADWCGPCKALHPTLVRVEEEFHGKVLVSKINIDKNPELAQKFGVKSIPALFYFKNGKLINKQSGNQPISILAQQLNSLINQ